MMFDNIAMTVKYLTLRAYFINQPTSSIEQIHDSLKYLK